MSWLRANRLFHSRWINSSLVLLGMFGAFFAGTVVSGRASCPSAEALKVMPCTPKQRQSPINLQPTLQVTLAPLQYDYKPVPLMVVHNGHTLQVNYVPGSVLTLNGELYKLEKLHFQTPSEHTVADMPYAMEAQLVHRQDDHVVIVGVLIEVGEANPTIQKIWEHMPAKSKLKKTFNHVTVNAADLLPVNLEAYYRYSGSLTDPPYDENVTWIVMREPITVSVAQLEQFVNAMGQTARPGQPLHHRLILEAF